eukprot:jgi/Hompol1/1290/HPOL_003530-RA
MELLYGRAVRGQPFLPLPVTNVADTERSSFEISARQQLLLATFFSNPISPEFPVQTNLDGFLSSDFSKSEILVHAMCSIAAKYTVSSEQNIDEDDVSMLNAGDDQFFRCLDLMGSATINAPSYATMTALTYISFYGASSGRATVSWTSIALASRLAAMIGLDNERHHPDAASWSPAEREIRRRLYWTLFELDRFSSMASRMPVLMMRASPSKVPFPSGEPLTVFPEASPATPQQLFQESVETPAVDPTDKPNSSEGTSLLPGSFMPVSATNSRSNYLSLLLIATKIHELLLDENEMFLESVTTSGIDEFARRRQMIVAELNEFFLRMPFSMAMIQPELLSSPTFDPRIARTNMVTIIIFHHIRICLFSAQFFRLFEFGLQQAIISDPYFSLALESAMIVYECYKTMTRIKDFLWMSAPAVVRSAVTAIRILKIAQAIGFMGVDAAMVDEAVETFSFALRIVKRYWIWGRMAYDAILAEHSGQTRIASSTRVVL